MKGQDVASLRHSDKECDECDTIRIGLLTRPGLDGFKKMADKAICALPFWSYADWAVAELLGVFVFTRQSSGTSFVMVFSWCSFEDAASFCCFLLFLWN